MERTRWYKNGVFYQVWPRSFKDGDGDGMGDLYGVYEKLDYIKSLGVDGIWFNPLYPSPGADCGYDIADYTDIAPEFGGMEAFKRVLDGAHERGMKVIMDLVVNHTSDEHEWFQKSRRRIPPYTDYYIWRDKPNNWNSLFEGGSAWQWDELRGQYYLHLFAIKQPDLNMDNPLVREEVVKLLRFWLDMGVDGFREDVITFISKKEGLPNDYLMPVATGLPNYNYGPHFEEYMQQFRQGAFEGHDYVIIAESAMTKPKQALKYTAESDNNIIDMMIQFECMGADCLITDFYPLPFSLRKLKKAFSSWQEGINGKGGWNMLYLENHDHSRVVSRYGSEKYRAESAKMLCAAYMLQQGTPFIYMGQELGMTNWYPDSMEQYEDVQTRNQHLKLPEKLRLKISYSASRDSARTPMPWSGGKNAGFTTADKPWFYINPNYTEINVEAEEADPDSVLNFYREAVRLKKQIDRDAPYKELHKSSRRIFAYQRGDEYEIVCSFTEKPVKYDCGGEIVLSNYKENGEYLKPYECRVYRKH